MSNGIAGKVVVITGASSGLGEATARLLSCAGRERRAGCAAARSYSGTGGRAGHARRQGHRRSYGRHQQRAGEDDWSTQPCRPIGRIDVMINNAGLMPQSPLERLKIDDWDRMIDVNIKGVLYGIAAALPHMKQQKAGHFINVSSVAGHKVGPAGAVYAATKHRRARVVRGAAPGSEALQHPHDSDLPGRGSN